MYDHLFDNPSGDLQKVMITCLIDERKKGGTFKFSLENTNFVNYYNRLLNCYYKNDLLQELIKF